MEIRELKYFIEVAKEGNISKAAENLFITQPSLSRQITLLEEKLGVKLFERSNRNTTLTEKGKQFYQYAIEIIELVNKTESSIKEGTNISGEIVIGSGISSAMSIMAILMEKFNKQYPLVRFHLITGTKDQIMGKMDMGLIDIGIVIGSVGDEKYHNIKLNTKDRFVMLMKKDSLLADKEKIVPKDLVGVPLTIPKSQSGGNFLDWLGKYKDKINVFTTHDLLDNVIPSIKRGTCNAITLEANGKVFVGDELCYKELNSAITFESFIVWDKHKVNTATVSKFIEFIDEYFENKTTD